MSAVDRYAEWDAAYVLGALDAAQRHEYEAHLAGCAGCRHAVGELAAMPGLLAQVPTAEALALTSGWPEPSAPGPAEAVPSSPVADPDPTSASARRRPRPWLVALAAALVLVVGMGLGAAVRGWVQPAPADRLAFVAVEPSSITAVVDLVPTSVGTEITVECQYGAVDTEPGDERYAIWVVDRSGRGTEVKPWTVRPNKVMRPSGRTDLTRSQLASVEIRDVATGQTVLRAVP